MSYGRERGPLAVAHRGGAGLAPENTLAAFRMASALGVRYLETDVRVTADGALVCLHDDRLDRVSDATGPVAARTLAELRRVRVGGEPVPALAEVLEELPDVRVTVDLKDRATLGPMARLLRDPRVAERVCVAGAWDGRIAWLREQAPGVATALGWRSLTALVGCARAGVPVPGWVASAPFAHVPAEIGRLPVPAGAVLARAHALGVRVLVWTVDDRTRMSELLDVGVDGIITDRPDVLREVLIERGAWSPMPGSTRPAPPTSCPDGRAAPAG